MTDEEIAKAIELMPENVIYLSTREMGLETNVGGVKGEVIDYTISITGLSEKTGNEWKKAIDTNHDAAVKVQINNSWENSTLPYLPVFSLLKENVQRAADAGAAHIMLSWTLGGYPSPNIQIISELFFEEDGSNNVNTLKSLYGDDAELVSRATDIFSEAFKEFPFHVQTLYTGPQNGGISNQMFMESSGRNATMTGYAYDDLESWRSDYPEDIFENQFRLLCEKWNKGLKLLEKMDDCELKDMAEGSYIQFASSYNQIRFVRQRTDKQSLIPILKEETELAVRMHKIMERNPAVGFEAANHYYYTQNSLKEKVINCQWLLDKLV